VFEADKAPKAIVPNCGKPGGRHASAFCIHQSTAELARRDSGRKVKCALRARRCCQPATGEWLREEGLAPEKRIEPTTLRSTAEPLVPASHCKNRAYTRRDLIFTEIGGTTGH
jgi:hypothetical protein